MNSGKIVADGTGRDGTGGKIEGSTRGPRGPKKGEEILDEDLTYPDYSVSWFFFASHK